MSYVEDGTDDFKAILSLSPIAGNEYFISFDIPNTGNLTFSQTFLLVGFTTQGESISSQDRYVSEFSFQYSDSLDNPYQTYSQVFHYISSLCQCVNNIYIIDFSSEHN